MQSPNFNFREMSDSHLHYTYLSSNSKIPCIISVAGGYTQIEYDITTKMRIAVGKLGGDYLRDFRVKCFEIY